MYSKEEQALTKDMVEAIKKIAERQEKECPKCRGAGQCFYPDFDDSSKEDYLDKCDCKNGKVKGKWEWKPKLGEWCVNKEGGYPQLISEIDKKTGDLYLSSASGHIWLYSVNFIPLLDWQKIEKILKETGYVLEEPTRLYYGSEGFKYHCVISLNSKRVGWGLGKSRQLAVMRAVIELGKELTKR